jgi:3-phosphoshikimate 1-carboxyvinyltransferase
MNKSQRITIQPLVVNGNVNAIASKSYYQRALAIALLSKGKTILHNVSDSGDVLAVKSILLQLGLELNEANNSLIINNFNSIDYKNLNINVGESGLALRMFSFITSVISNDFSISGEGTLLSRPLKPLIDSLVNSGLSVENTNLPIQISGKISKKNIEIDGSFSSQMLSGLLISLPLMPHDTLLTVRNPVSKPYIEMTLELMNQFGICIKHQHYCEYQIFGNQKYTAKEVNIEGDWSGAANWLVGAAISGKICVHNLNPESAQADRKILEALKLYGANIDIKSNCIIVEKNQAKPFEFDATDCPDIFPPLLLLAVSANGTSRIKGRQRLLFKESNRSESLIDTFTKLGAQLETNEDEIVVYGTGKLIGNQTIDSYSDHRIAMIAALAATLNNQPIEITNPDCVHKSYPNFFQDLQNCSQQKPIKYE